MGRGLLHFRSLLSVSTFVVFAAPTAVVSLWISGVLISHPDLRQPGISLVDGKPPTSPLSSLTADGRGGPGVLSFRKSCGSQFPSSSFSLASPFVLEGDFVTCFCLIFLYILFYVPVLVSVFFPHFCTGLLLRGCYM